MAFQIFWKIPFKSLRTGTLYTVNIYKDGALPSGYPLTLKGGDQPFVTEEDSDEDMFTPIRTQTGYLRFVDDGKAEDSSNQPQEVTFDWKDLIPATDTARPVTLTHQSGGQTFVDWQGFMQAQDFGSTLYGNPQEREFPIQCVLSVTQGTDINYQQTEIQNFAYLLKQIVDSIPSAQRPTSFMIQGGEDAQAWLLKKIDWQNFVSEDGDGNLVARFSMYQCLEDMCRFWGWTARTCGRTLYLTMADDATTEPNWLSLNSTQLATMAGGTAAGTTTDTFDTTTLAGDIFASTNQDDFVQRGHNKAVVNADGNTADESIIEFAPPIVHDAFVYPSKYNIIVSPYITPGDDDIRGSIDYEYYGTYPHRIDVTFIPNILSFPQKKILSPFLKGTSVDGKAYFTAVRLSTGELDDADVIRINKSYDPGVVIASLETVFEHSINGKIILHGDIFLKGAKYINLREYSEIGNTHMYIRLGIGKTRETASWYSGSGSVWSSTPTSFKVNIGNQKDTFYFPNGYEYIHTNHAGKIFIDFLGSDDTELVDGSYSGGGTLERRFFISKFSVEYIGLRENPDPRRRATEMKNDAHATYVASNNNDVRNEFNIDTIYASFNLMKPGYGIIMNEDYSFVEAVTYGNNSIRPEQHLADRVVNYWQTSKRRLEVELRSNQIADITPQYKVTLDGTTGYPIAISHDWWNDITTLTILEL